MKRRSGSSARSVASSVSVGGSVTARFVVEHEVEAGVVLDLLARHARIETRDLHPPLLVVEREDGKLGDDAQHAAERQPAVGAAGAAADEAGTGDEIDLVDEAAFLVLHRHDHVGEARNVVAAAGPGQAHRRLLRIADEGRIEVAVLVDLRAPHEAHVDIAALEQEQHIGAAEHHVGALGAALVVGGRGKLAGFHESPDHAAFEQDRQARAAQPLRERGGQQRNAHPGEHHLPFLELAGAQDGQRFLRIVAIGFSHCRCSCRAGSPRAAPQRRSGTDSRSMIWARRHGGRDICACLRPGPC